MNASITSKIQSALLGGWVVLCYLVVPCCLAIPCAKLQAQCSTGEVEIFGISGGDYLGRSVAISGGRLFIGAIGDDSGGTLSGSVRIFRKNGSGYQLEELLLGSSNDQIGAALAADRDLLAIGAIGTGTIQIWQRDRFGWNLIQLLSDPEGHEGDGFGSALSMSGNVLAVGSPYFQLGSEAVGCVTMWIMTENNDWYLQERLMAIDRVPGDQFGTSVDLSDSLNLLVGAPGRDHLGPDSGAAFLFSGGQDGWIEEFTIGTGVANPGDRLGTAVAISEEHLLLGAPYSDLAGPAAGAVANYHRVGEVWVIGPHLVPPSGASGCAFGAVLAMAGTVLSVGAPTDTGGEAFPTGSLSIFRWQGDWQLEGVRIGNSSSFLGSSVAVDQGVVIAGAPLDSQLAAVGGNVIIEVYGEGDCDQDGELDSCAIALGTAQDCDLDGMVDICGITSGVTVDCDGDSIPDSCATLEGTVADCDGDGIPDSCSVASGQVTDCDNDGIPDRCQVDCNQNLIPDSCEILETATLDCDLDGVIDDCEISNGSELDCNSNGTLDSCEPDCDGDGIPDECEIISGTAEDCDNNLVPDLCDLEDSANDINGNGQLDACEPQFIRGDADGVEGVHLADAILLIARVFGEVAIPYCQEAADANSDGLQDISDGLYLLMYLFMGGEAPSIPFPTCGISASDAAFTCDLHPACP
ncbi:MAG: hypothetical protein OSB09_04420 [Planctomycetota bacterium]|nr:hypothetical protein [Planctomycetota bacterium]